MGIAHGESLSIIVEIDIDGIDSTGYFGDALGPGFQLLGQNSSSNKGQCCRGNVYRQNRR